MVQNHHCLYKDGRSPHNTKPLCYTNGHMTWCHTHSANYLVRKCCIPCEDGERRKVAVNRAVVAAAREKALDLAAAGDNLGGMAKGKANKKNKWH